MTRPEHQIKKPSKKITGWAMVRGQRIDGVYKPYLVVVQTETREAAVKLLEECELRVLEQSEIRPVTLIPGWPDELKDVREFDLCTESQPIVTG